MALTKVSITTITPAVPEVLGRPQTAICTPNPPPEVAPPTGPQLPTVPPPAEQARIYLYDNAGTGDSRTPWLAPAPAGYVCTTGVFFLFIDGLGYCPVYETRCYAP